VKSKPLPIGPAWPAAAVNHRALLNRTSQEEGLAPADAKAGRPLFLTCYMG
jgi:hypothetical protein